MQVESSELRVESYDMTRILNIQLSTFNSELSTFNYSLSKYSPFGMLSPNATQAL